MIETIGWISVFIVGGLLFAIIVAAITLHLTERYEIGALVFAGLAFKIALAVWLVLFFLLSPVSISIGTLIDGYEALEVQSDSITYIARSS